MRHVTVKGDNSLLFRKLNEMNVMHRVIMTGVSLYIRPLVELTFLFRPH